MAGAEGKDNSNYISPESSGLPSPRDGLHSPDLESGLPESHSPEHVPHSDDPKKDYRGVFTVSVSCIEGTPIPTPLATVRGLDLGARVDISFKGLGFTARTKNGGRLNILRHVSGSCKGGRLMAIAGPSGAGKVCPTTVPTSFVILQRARGF
jgi:ABC-type multidrug transport system fused ATPase/permease subunit